MTYYLQDSKGQKVLLHLRHQAMPYRFTLFYRFAVKMQIGTYLGDNKGKGGFFMRPALRYNLSKRFFAQIGLKTLDGGAANYIEYGMGLRMFSW